MATTVARIEGLDVAIWIHTAIDPSQSEWDACHANMIAMLAGLGGPLQKRRGFIVSDGAAPNAKQRKDVGRDIWCESKKLPASVITPMLDNPLKRGVATAIMWIQPQLKFMRPTQWHEAIAHIGLKEGDELLRTIILLQQTVAHIAMIDHVQVSARRVTTKTA